MCIFHGMCCISVQVPDSTVQLSKEFWNSKSLMPSGAMVTAEELEQGRQAEDQRNADCVRLEMLVLFISIAINCMESWYPIFSLYSAIILDINLMATIKTSVILCRGGNVSGNFINTISGFLCLNCMEPVSYLY